MSGYFLRGIEVLILGVVVLGGVAGLLFGLFTLMSEGEWGCLGLIVGLVAFVLFLGWLGASW